MIRNLKALGLALVAVFAMSAIAASAASATEAEFSWDAGTTELKFTQDPTDPSQTLSFTNGALAFTCNEVHGRAVVAGTSSKEITGTEITYNQSGQAADTCKGPFGTSPSFKTNNCHFTFKAGTTVGEKSAGHSTGTMNIKCTGANPIEWSAPGCLFKIPAQENVGDITYKTVKTGTKEEITIEAKVHSPMTHAPNTLKYEHSGFLCGTGSATDGTYTGKFTVQGFNSAGAQTNVTVT